MLESGDFEAGERDASQWMSIMKLEIMSSDESGMDDEEEVIIVHALPSLSEAVKDLKSLLDQRIVAAKTPQAKRQMKRRMTGISSSRSPSEDLPTWALNKT